MVYNIRNFGAIGDGVANDTAAIQAAIDAAHAAGGGEVYIPAGTYAVTGTGQASDGAILLYDNVTVYGDGMGASTVKVKDGWSGDITGIFRTPYGVENHDITVRDLTLDGNQDNTSGHIYGWFNGYIPGEDGADRNITLDSVEIMNCDGYGFDPHEQTINLVISNCVSHDNRLDGYAIDYQIDGQLINNVAYNNGRHGFNIVTSTHDLTMIGNVAYGNGSQGIMVQRGSDDIPVPDNILIQGGSVYGNGGDGIQINKADHVTIDGVDIHDNGQRGVRIMGSVGSTIENSTIHNNSASKGYAYEEIRIESYDDTSGVSGRVYQTTGTTIQNNTITDNGAARTSYAVREMADGTDHTTVAGNNIYGTGNDRPSLAGANSTFSYPPLAGETTDPNAPTLLYAPLLGQSNAELFKNIALDGTSGLSHVESGLLAQTGFSQVVTMTNMAVGGSTVDGDRSPNQKPNLVWWYPDQNKPGPALLQAVEQMKHQISALGENAKVTPIVIWAQGESESNQLGTSKSDGGRRLAEMEYINSTRLVFNYIQNHVDPDIQFYIMQTGRFNETGALNYGYPQTTIDKQNLGLQYVHDAQVKMALAYTDVHLAVNYIDLPMNADVSPDVPNYKPDWAKDSWHLSLDSQAIAAERLANFIALDMGKTHILDNPGPYPRAALADLTVHAGTGVNVTGNSNDNIIVGTTGNDTLSGGNGNDILIGGGGRDVLNGGAGSDTFYYAPSIVKHIQAGAGSTQNDTITGFQTGAGGDVVDVSALLRAVGYTGADPLGAGYIRITQQGADTVISFDPDGQAGTGYGATVIARLTGVNASQFSLADNLVTQFPSGNALVLDARQPPRSKDDSFDSVLDMSLEGNVLANNGLGADTSPDGLALSVLAGQYTSAAGATVIMNANGTFEYMPVTGFAGTDTFTYSLRDSAGGRDTGTVTVNVTAPAGAVLGTEADEAIIAGSRDDIILGLGGNDVISGGSGNDTLYGGLGNDTLNGNSGNDVLYAVEGNDILNGNDGNDALYAGTGNDALYGGNGEDTLVAGAGNATMSGGSAADTFVFTKMGGVHTITDFKISQNEKIDITKLMAVFNPQAHFALDFIRATRQGGDTMLSLDADGALNGAAFVDFVLLKNVSSFNIEDLIDSGNLIVDDGVASTNLNPLARADSFSGWAGLQVSGNVLQDNGSGADSDPDGGVLSVISATATTAGGGTVTMQADGSFIYTPLAGFSGADNFNYTLLDGQGGSAVGTVTLNISGGTNGTNGDDNLTGGSRDDVMHGMGGNDTISGGSGHDIIYAGAGNDVLNGNKGNDTLYAESGNNVLHGNDDNDTLYGGSGTDQLYGDNGNDVLVAGTGSTAMTGGGGADTFVLRANSGLAAISDFRTSVGDRIDISDLLDAYDPVSHALSDFVRATKQGSDMLLSVDRDGAGNGAQFTGVCVVQGTSNLDIEALVSNGNLVI